MQTLSEAVFEQDVEQVKYFLSMGAPINSMDEYGSFPLINAAIMNDLQLAKILLAAHANPNQQDAMGGTALQWAVENNNIGLSTLLLENGADPNAYNFSGQPILVMPTLRQQKEIRRLLIQHGADQVFAQDFINTKLLGHIYELIGMATIIDPNNRIVEVDFEGFFLEITVGIIADALEQFQSHFAARQLRRYSNVTQFIVEVMQRALKLIKYQQYQFDRKRVQSEIDSLLAIDPILIPVGYEGHAITFIKFNDIWIKCDRREDSRLYDNIVFYRITKPAALTPQFLYEMFYKKKTAEFVNQEIDVILGLQPLSNLKVEAQISGNCSWANVEAVVPAIFCVILQRLNQDYIAENSYKTLAINYFHKWREWNKERALDFCLQSFSKGDALRKTSKAEILAAILFQRCKDPKDSMRCEKILSALANTPYEYLLHNYVKIYYYESYTEEGKQFFDLLKAHGVIRR